MQRQLKCGRAGGDRRRGLEAHGLGECLFEPLDQRSGRGDPAIIERRQQGVPLSLAEIGSRQDDS